MRPILIRFDLVDNRQRRLRWKTSTNQPALAGAATDCVVGRAGGRGWTELAKEAGFHSYLAPTPATLSDITTFRYCTRSGDIDLREHFANSASIFLPKQTVVRGVSSENVFGLWCTFPVAGVHVCESNQVHCVSQSGFHSTCQQKPGANRRF